MRHVVLPKTKEGYLNRNVNLVLWLYDNEAICKEFLKAWMVDAMNTADNLDKALVSLQQHQSRKRANLRKHVKEALRVMNKSDDNCPLILEKMSFNIFSHYSSTQKKHNGNYLSSTAYGGLRSALFHVYRMSGTPIPDETRK